MLSGSGSTTFYSVQSANDAERLLTTGTPWPTEPYRAALGEGVYAWSTMDEAMSYLQKMKMYAPDARIVEFSIKNSVLSNLRSLNVDKLVNPEKWMEMYSKLWGGTPNHGLQYIQRATNIGIEHFFSQSIYTYLNF